MILLSFADKLPEVITQLEYDHFEDSPEDVLFMDSCLDSQRRDLATIRRATAGLRSYLTMADCANALSEFADRFAAFIAREPNDAP